MTSHITLMSLHIRLTGLYNHESLMKIFDYEIDLIKSVPYIPYIGYILNVIQRIQKIFITKHLKSLKNNQQYNIIM